MISSYSPNLIQDGPLHRALVVWITDFLQRVLIFLSRHFHWIKIDIVPFGQPRSWLITVAQVASVQCLAHCRPSCSSICVSFNRPVEMTLQVPIWQNTRNFIYLRLSIYN